MLIVECDQGSKEWHVARAGVITASNFSLARKRLKTGASKGDYAKDAKDYAFKLAIERISGQPLEEGFETWQMRRGHELEPTARMLHEERTGLFVTRTGFVKTEDSKFGASADGLINEDGGSEYKCFIAPEKLRSILIDDEDDDVIDQVQGCLWITNRKWWDFCLYCPALESIGQELYIKRVNRDDEYIAKMELELMEFERMVTRYETTLRNRSKS